VLFLNAYITASLIGLLVKYKNARHAIHVVRHSEDLLRSDKRRKDFWIIFESPLLNNALLALGKVPGPEAESVSHKEARFSRVDETRRSYIAELDERRTFCRSKVMQGGINFWCSTRRGLLSLCPTFFKSEKVNGQRLKTVNVGLSLKHLGQEYSNMALPIREWLLSPPRTWADRPSAFLGGKLGLYTVMKFSSPSHSISYSQRYTELIHFDVSYLFSRQLKLIFHS